MTDRTNRLPLPSDGVVTMSDEQLIQHHRNLTKELLGRCIEIGEGEYPGSALKYTKVFK
jgi:hypothetical protein